MVTLRNMKPDEIKTILSWNETSEAFLKQWSNFTYPLTEEQFLERINSKDYHVFSIDSDDKLVGTIQIFNLDKEHRTARVGCYLIHPQIRGNGIGRKALEIITDYAFNYMNLDQLTLGVFDYNTGAIKCYQNAGYVKIGEYQHPMGWTGYHMAKNREVHDPIGDA